MEWIRAGIFAVPGASAFDKSQPTGMRLGVEPLERANGYAGDLTVTTPSERTQADDSDFGFWIDGGVTWRLGGHLNLGVEVRYSRVKLEFGDITQEKKVPGGGFHAGALVGFGW